MPLTFDILYFPDFATHAHAMNDGQLQTTRMTRSSEISQAFDAYLYDTLSCFDSRPEPTV